MYKYLDKNIILPKVEVGKTIGFLEILDDYGSKVDIAKIAADLLLDLDDVLPVVDTAEMFNFIKVEDGDLTLTKNGLEFVTQGIRGRKKIINNCLNNTTVFQIINKEINKDEEKSMDKEELLSILRTLLPDTEVENAFRIILEWGRHGLLLRYDSEDSQVRMI